MSVLEDVRDLVARLAPAAVCDDCVTSTLALAARQHASRSVRELAGADGFERQRGPCSLCGAEKLVVRRR